MKLTNFVSISQPFIIPFINEQFYKICKSKDDSFQQATIVLEKGQEVDTKVRNTKTWSLNNVNLNEITTMHWANYFACNITKCMNDYMNQFMPGYFFTLNDIQVLKYEPGGFYNFHVDHGNKISRTLSFIYFINDDYEGGDLIFQDPSTKEEYKIEKKKNQVVVWPSNFLYPHKVTPVKKGVRYSIVAWAL